MLDIQILNFLCYQTHFKTFIKYYKDTALLKQSFWISVLDIQYSSNIAIQLL